MVLPLYIDQISVSAELSQLEAELIAAIPSIILFIITIIIGYFVAVIVANAIKVFLTRFFRQAHELVSIDLVSGTVKAFIILISLAIALSLLSLGSATAYVQAIARYLPYLAGAILLLSLGITLINTFTDYMQKQMNVSDEFIQAILSILKFGLYATIIDIAAVLAIFYWVPFVNQYLFLSIILGSVIMMATITISDKVLNNIQKAHPDLSLLVGYGRFLLYTLFIIIGIAIIVQPFFNVTSILYAVAWGLAIAFAIALIPIIVYISKRFLSEIK